MNPSVHILSPVRQYIETSGDGAVQKARAGVRTEGHMVSPANWFAAFAPIIRPILSHPLRRSGSTTRVARSAKAARRGSLQVGFSALILTLAIGAVIPPARAAQTVVANYSGTSLYVVDLTTGDRVVLSSGTVGTGPTLTQPVAAVMDANQNLYIGTASAIIKVDVTNGNRTLIPNPGSLSYSTIYGLAFDAQGNLIAGSSTAGAIYSINVTTGIRTTLASATVGTGVAAGLPGGVLVDTDGTIVYTDFNTLSTWRLIRLDPTTLVRTHISSPIVTPLVGTGTQTGLSGTVVKLSDGSFAVSCYSGAATQWITRVDPATGNRTILTGSATGTGPAITSTYALSISSDGSIYASDFGGAAVVRIDPTTGNRTLISKSGTVGAGPAFVNPLGLLSATVASVVPSPPAVTSALTAGGTNGFLFSYTITASNTPTSFGATGLPTGLTVDTSTGVISGTITQAGTFTVALSATGAGGTGTANLALTVAKAAQTITFPAPADKLTTDAAFALTATSSSGLAISYAIASGPATVSGSTVTLTGATGTVVVSAAQAGDQNYSAAADVSQPFTVTAVAPQISSASTASGVYGTAFSYATTATNTPTSFGASGLPTGLIINSSTGAIGGTVTQTGTFTVTLSATNAGGTGTATLTLTITTAVQTITFAAPPDKHTTDDPFALVATASSGLPVTFAVVSGPATVSGSTVTVTGVGTVVLRATQAGDLNYSAATADQMFVVLKVPVVTAGNISISGGSGPGGAFQLADTVTATWNNTAGGDNNTDIVSVTFDFTQFGGGAAVAASNSLGTWTATYTIVAGFTAAGSHNVSVTVTDNVGTATTTMDNTIIENQAPINSAPGAQSLAQDSSLVFNSAHGNLISISDGDAGGASVQVTLTATNGTVALSGTSGLSFSVGSGSGDSTVTFTGTLANINSALNGLTYTPAAGYFGSASLQILTNDLGNTGSGGAKADTDTVSITVVTLNLPPTGIILSGSSVYRSAGVNAVIGALSSTDVDNVSFTYTLVSGAGSTDNSSFNIIGTTLRANDASLLTAASYSVRIRTTDSGTASFEKSFVIHVIANSPAPASDGFGGSATGGAGAGAEQVGVENAVDFRAHVESPVASVITIVGTVDLGSGTVEVKSNKTIQGFDDNTTLVGNLNIASNVTNVVIRGLTITNQGATQAGAARQEDILAPSLTGSNAPAVSNASIGGAAITISGARDVFITHCSFFDCTDYAVKITDGSDNVSISWSEFGYTSGQGPHRASILIGNAGTETAPLHVSLHHNVWSAGVDQGMPAATYGYVHLYNNYFNTPGNTSGTEALDQSQFLSERNVYASVNNPLTRRQVNPALPTGRILAIDNLYTATTGTAPYAGADAVFTPSYSYEALPVSDVVAVVTAHAGNTGGTNETETGVGSATLSGPAAPVIPGTSFTLNVTPKDVSPSTYQWRRDNLDIPGATASSYRVASAQKSSAGTYTVALGLASDDMVVSTPLVVTLGTVVMRPSTPVSSTGGGGAISSWLVGALALLTLLRLGKRQGPRGPRLGKIAAVGQTGDAGVD